MDYSGLITAVIQFFKDNQALLGQVAKVVGAICASGAAAWKIWVEYRKWRRQKRLPSGTFPFLVIPPRSEDVLQQLLSERAAKDSSLKDDQLASFNIPHQVRREDRNVRQEIESRLNGNRWLLIVGRTGLGKTREAAEVARLWNNEGWTVLKLVDQGWLDESLEYPMEQIGTKRKLLFFVDDLQQLIYLSREVKYAQGADDPNKPLRVPLPDRLLRTLERYEKECGADQIRVIATARNERNSEHSNTPSEWEKLALDNYPKLKAKFELYELPDPEERALVALLEDRRKVAGISAKAEDFPAIARRNDGTFSNIVENLNKVRNPDRKLVLSLETFTDTLQGTWQERYERAVRNYRGARYIYDAVELLQQLEIELLPEIVTPTARLIAGGRGLRQWCYWWQIRQTLHHLIQSERILEPRDGQIEAKQYPVEVVRFIPAVRTMLLQLFKRAPKRYGYSLDGYVRASKRYEYYEDALIALVEIVHHFPHVAFVWSEKGNVEGELKRYDEAIASYDQVIKLKPTAVAYTIRGNALARLRRQEEAIASYDQAIKLQRDYAIAYINRGVVQGKLGRQEEAIASYDQAIGLQPDNADAHIKRGNALHQLGRQEEAIASYDQAIGLQPDNAIAYNNRGTALSELGRQEEAIASYEQAIALKPSAEAYINQGIDLGELGRYEEAIANYDQAIALKPDYATAYTKRGTALSELGRQEEAIANYDQAIALKPDEAEAFTNRGYALVQLERYEEAIISCGRALEIQPCDAAYYNRGNALAGLGRYEEAISSFNQAIALQPDDAKAYSIRGIALYYNRGYALARLGRYEEAIASYDQAIKLQPSYAKAHHNRGYALARLRRYEEAISSFNQAIALQPDDAKAYSIRGMALAQLGEYEEAITSCDRALEIQSNSDDVALYAKACIYALWGKIDESVQYLYQAISLDSKWRERAKTDSDFDGIREDKQFQQLCGQ